MHPHTHKVAVLYTVNSKWTYSSKYDQHVSHGLVLVIGRTSTSGRGADAGGRQGQWSFQSETLQGPQLTLNTPSPPPFSISHFFWGGGAGRGKGVLHPFSAQRFAAVCRQYFIQTIKQLLKTSIAYKKGKGEVSAKEDDKN